MFQKLTQHKLLMIMQSLQVLLADYSLVPVKLPFKQKLLEVLLMTDQLTMM